MPMLEFHLRRIQISGIVHSQRSIQEDMMCLGGIHVPESLVPPGTLSPSVHWACLLPASSQLHVGHQIGRPCILLHSLLFPPSYLQETIKKITDASLMMTLLTPFLVPILVVNRHQMQ